GFVFASSKRKVDADQAAILIRAMRAAGSRALAAGVFVNPTMHELKQVMLLAPLDVIQLHGAETPEYCGRIKSHFPGVSIYRVFSVPADSGSVDADGQIAPFRGVIDAVMIDTQGGGTGKTFAW